MDALKRILEGTSVTAAGGGLALRTCLRHLSALGADCSSVGGEPGTSVAGIEVHSGRDRHLEALLGWRPGSRQRDSEATIQASCGLMEVHGRRIGRPARLGVEVASVAAGVLASQSILAGLLARMRGGGTARVGTSVLQAGLVFVSHYLAGATADDLEEWGPAEEGPEPGPPFSTANGHRFEMEALDGDAWKAFWELLGLSGPVVGRAWMGYLPRYRTATCRLPAGFHAATARRTLAEIAQLAGTAGVSICRLRSYPEAVADLVVEDMEARGRLRPPWHIEPLAGGSGAGLESDRNGGVAFVPGRGEGGALPLAGLRVVEVARRLQGPLAGLLLRMLGAEVIRIEPPGGDARRWMPPVAGDVSAIFLAFNRGKQPVELDVKRPAGRQAVLDLVADADVFLHNWAPGKAVELGLDFEDLAPHNPRLVYAHASGWGDRLGSRPPFGTDYLVQAHAGMADALTPADELPMPSLVTLTDVCGGMLATEAVLAGLLLRERSGRGCRVDSSMLAGALSLQAHALEAYAAGREQGRCAGRPLWGALDRPLQTADGYLAVTVEGDEDLRLLTTLCQAPQGSGVTLEEGIARRLREEPTASWEHLFRHAGVPAAAVCTNLAALPTELPMAETLLEQVNGCWFATAPWTFSL